MKKYGLELDRKGWFGIADSEWNSLIYTHKFEQEDIFYVMLIFSFPKNIPFELRRPQLERNLTKAFEKLQVTDIDKNKIIEIKQSILPTDIHLAIE